MAKKKILAGLFFGLICRLTVSLVQAQITLESAGQNEVMPVINSAWDNQWSSLITTDRPFGQDPEEPEFFAAFDLAKEMVDTFRSTGVRINVGQFKLRVISVRQGLEGKELVLEEYWNNSDPRFGLVGYVLTSSAKLDLSRGYLTRRIYDGSGRPAETINPKIEPGVYVREINALISDVEKNFPQDDLKVQSAINFLHAVLHQSIYRHYRKIQVANQ